MYTARPHCLQKLGKKWRQGKGLTGGQLLIIINDDDDDEEDNDDDDDDDDTGAYLVEIHS